jgi:hypothetical protein
MRKFKGKTVEEIIGSLDAQQREIVGKLRSTAKKTLPKIVETVKWGNITYLLGDKNLAWIIIYKDHVDFGFFRGAELESKLLEGTGKGLRHIKIRSSSDLDEPEITRLLKRAAEL